jgi:hypothetical protein
VLTVNILCLPSWQNSNSEEEQQRAQEIADWYKDYFVPGTETLEPLSNLYFPVFDQLSQVNPDPTSQSAVAILGVSFYW